MINYVRQKTKGVRKSSYTREDLSFKTHEILIKTDSEGDYTKGVRKTGKKSSKLRTPQGVQPEINGIKITELDVQICKYLKDHCHTREVSRRLNKPVMSISYRIRRLERAGRLEAHAGAYNAKVYNISDNLQLLLIHNEDEPYVAGFTAHAMSFKFPLISGEQPDSHLPKLYFLRNVGSAEKGIKIHILFPFRLFWLISGEVR